MRRWPGEHLPVPRGGRDLNPGDSILPPDATGVETVKAWAGEAGLDGSIIRTDRVFLTPHVEAAAMFAALSAARWPDERGAGGDLYAVIAEPPVEPDPDWHGEPGGSVQCPSAVVVHVVRRRLHIAEFAEALGL